MRLDRFATRLKRLNWLNLLLGYLEIKLNVVCIFYGGGSWYSYPHILSSVEGGLDNTLSVLLTIRSLLVNA